MATKSISTKKKVRKSPPKKRAVKPVTRVKKHPGGRPTDFKPEYSSQVEMLCKLGATDKQIADFFGVAESTVNNWKKKHLEFLESMRAGKDIADMMVAQKLFERATGSRVAEQIPVKVKEVKFEKGRRIGEIEKVEIVTISREIPPDTVAAKFWLNNRKSDSWKEKIDHKVVVSEEVEVEII